MSYSTSNVPSDASRAVFTADVLARLRKSPSPSVALIHRISVLIASGPYPSDPWVASTIRQLRARRAAWDTYLGAAFACGLFEGPHGSDLTSRLTGEDDDGFRSAIAECLACWLLAGPLRLPVKPRPSGQGRSVLELLVECPDGEAFIEVKAPRRERPVTGGWFGHDSDLLESCMEQATRQFQKGCRNVLLLVPQLRTPAFNLRVQLTAAFVGQQKITIPIDTRTGGPAGPTQVQFFPDGKFLNPRLPDGKFMKLDRRPGFTRISAVVCVEEDYNEGIGFIFHRMLVLHNPYAEKPISPQMWGNCPQFLLEDGKLGWTDGHPLNR